MPTAQSRMFFGGRTVGQDQSRAGIIPEKFPSTASYAVSPILLAFIHQFIRSLDNAFDGVVWVAHTCADGDSHTQVFVNTLKSWFVQ